jgi:hypothetical protein
MKGEIMTKEQAIKLWESKFWESMSFQDRAKFQLFEDMLCMPFDIFHEAVEKSLGRPVFTHEFGLNVDNLRKELLGKTPAPSFDEIVGLIPENKHIIVLVE